MSAEQPLSDADRALLSARADAFYAALSRNQSPGDWEPFLQGVPSHLRAAVLGELVVVDIVRRWQRGERPLLESYIDRFPELGPLDRVSTKLITEEYRARLRAGDPRDADQYRRRFPVQYPRVEDDLFRIEQESGSRGKSGSYRPVGTVAPTDTSRSGPAAAAGTVRGSQAVRSSGVTSSQQRGRTAEYTKLKKLGAGQFGEVWLVESRTTGIKKAMKVMLRPADDEAGKRELRSLDLIKNEQHPYLLRTEDYWVDDNKLYVLMELADGTLRNWLAQHNPGKEGRQYTQGVPAGELLHVLREAAEVMDDLHAKQVMHRDIKPDNILLLNRHAKVADFGLARQQDAAVATQSMMAGSPAYMAPEVWAGKFGAASDQYSLAVTYSELRQGQLPVKLGPMAEIMFAHLEGEFHFRPDVFSKPEVAVIRRALAKEPGQRYASCSEFVAELVRVVGAPLALPAFRPGGGTSPKLSALPPVPPMQETDTLVPLAGDTLEPPRPRPQYGRETKAFKPKRKANWIGGAVAGGVILALLSLIVFLLVGPPASPTAAVPSATAPYEGKPTDPGPKPPPPSDEVWLPVGTKADPTGRMIPTVGGPVVPEWVTATVNGEVMRFRFIPAGEGVQSFYIGEQKVTNRAFGTPTGPGGADAPATNMTAIEVKAFLVKHFSGAKGRLPTPDEWDHAAGLYHQPPLTQKTVTKAGGEPWVNRKEPSPPRAGGKVDANVYDLLDMAGNGREWTCGVLQLDEPQFAVRSRPNCLFGTDDDLALRGRNYTLKSGLTFAQLQAEVSGEPQRQHAGVASPYTGFRVVLPGP